MSHPTKLIPVMHRQTTTFSPRRDWRVQSATKLGKLIHRILMRVYHEVPRKLEALMEWVGMGYDKFDIPNSPTYETLVVNYNSMVEAIMRYQAHVLYVTGARRENLTLVMGLEAFEKLCLETKPEKDLRETLRREMKLYVPIDYDAPVWDGYNYAPKTFAGMQIIVTPFIEGFALLPLKNTFGGIKMISDSRFPADTLTFISPDSLKAFSRDYADFMSRKFAPITEQKPLTEEDK